MPEPTRGAHRALPTQPPRDAAIYRRRRIAAGLVAVSVVALAAGGVRALAEGSGPAPTGSLSASGVTTSTLGTSPASAAHEPAPTGAGVSSGASTTSASQPTVVQHGPGTFTRVKVPGIDSRGPGRVVTFVLQIENGLRIDNAAAASLVRGTLANPRGWQTADKVRFVQLTDAQVSQGVKPTVTIEIASPDTVDKQCAPLTTEGELSCATTGRAVLNAVRWQLGVPYYHGDLTGYREYLINHEVGHVLGHGHQVCPAKGQRAPVMVQQTKGLQGCTAWPWPVRT
ncbi:DUF3152 domain-containing protein [Calidifontibacter sp. DB0510]|uniref:DUF3152 domain-containing protein n=1 Tax=Metallococcus carri TaxID=1656884 RepID=A0A967E7N8_9MICO|nr:DUF3152 domain-containing protein [Metallococcus carri]NHN54332.1 DUF3152 domain-containing protein [Metallococcus carri]NOP36828.1 DUF3152 domain-containing protein [Calidifontibacter sp. DB2511S]